MPHLPNINSVDIQVTVFVAILTMDANRQEVDRLDLCCCVISSKASIEEVRVERSAE